MRTITSWRSCAIVALSLTACIAESPAPTLGEEAQEIINGFDVNPEQSGWVFIGNNCSGTLVSNEWVLTAASCPTIVGNEVTMGSQRQFVDQILVNQFSLPYSDVALLHLSAPMRMNDMDTGYSRRISPGATSGTQVDCFGYGRGSPGGGYGVLRRARLTVTFSNNMIRFTPNALGQIHALGDQGSACLDDEGRVITVIHEVAATYSAGTKPALWWFWVENITLGRFGRSQFASDWACVEGQDCYLGDVDDDGDDDLVSFDAWNGDVWVSRSDGRRFGVSEKWHDAFCYPTETCRVGDVNRDGLADVIAFNRGTNGDVFVATSNGSRFNGTGQKWHDSFCFGSEVCDVGDVNNDGRVDIIAFTQAAFGGAAEGNVYVARSTGSRFDGTGDAAKWHDLFCLDNEVCKVGDVNADHMADIIAFDKRTGDVFVATSDGSRFNGTGVKWAENFCTGSMVCDVGDVSGDSFADIVAFTREASADVLVAVSSTVDRRGTQRFVAKRKWHDSFCRDGQICRLGKVDADNRVDIVAASRDGTGDVYWAQSLAF